MSVSRSKVYRLIQGAALIAVVLLATVAGVATAGFGTQTGERLLTDFAVRQLTNALEGVATVSSIEGTVTTGLTVRDLEVRDQSGNLFVRLPTATIKYRLFDLLSRRVVLGQVVLDSPLVNIYTMRNGRFNYQEVLGLGQDGGNDGPSPLVAFRGADIRHGTVVIHTPSEPPGPDDDFTTEMYLGRLMRVRRLEDLSAFVSYVRIASPFPQESGLQFDVDRLETRMTDPFLDIRDLNGRLNIDGSTLTLDLERLRLPGSEASLEGTLSWPDGALLLGLEIDASRWNVNDVRGLVETLPWNMQGRGHLSLQSINADSLRVRASPITLTAPDGGGSIAGSFGALVSGGLQAMDSTELTFDSLDIEFLRPLLDTIPLTGRLSGTLAANGPLDILGLDVEWTFHDSLVDGWPRSDVRGSGVVSMGENDEFVFFNFAVDSADIALSTIERMFPVVGLHGRLGGVGSLNGDWRNAVYSGRMDHRDGEGPVSRAIGTFQLDSRRDTVGLYANLVMDSLDFAGVHPSYPGLPAAGVMAGRLTVSGFTDSLALHVDAAGQLGQIVADAEFVLLPGLIVVSNVVADLTAFDLGPTHASLLPTELYGRITGGMVSDTAAPRGRFGLALDTSFVSGSAVDSVRGSIAFSDNVLRADSLLVLGPLYRGSVDGSFGMGSGVSGTLTVAAQIDSISVVDSLIRGLFPQLGERGRLTGIDGLSSITVRAVGGLEQYVTTIAMDIPALSSSNGAIEGATVRAVLNSDRNEPGSLDVTVDSLAVGRLGFGDLELRMSGPKAGSRWLARARIGADASWIGWGLAFSDAQVTTLQLDSTRTLLPGGVWNLEQVAVVSVSDSGYVFSNFRMGTISGSADISLTGTFPRNGSGDLRATVTGFPVADLWALLQRDPRSVGGEIGGSVQLGGTAADPVFDAAFALDQGQVGAVRIPYLRGITRYAEQRLVGEYDLIRRGDSILSIDFSLPVDLTLENVAVRRLPGDLSITATADSADLGFMEFVTSSVREATGAFDADFGVRGGWDDPVLTGFMSIRDGSARFPALGVRHEGLSGRVTLSGDTIHVDRFAVRSGGGTATVSGFVRLADLREPILELAIDAERFDSIDVPGFMTFRSTGSVALRGPLFGATLTGEGTLSDGVLYFADLIEKNIINLEDTLGVGSLIAAETIESQGLRADFENRFLDSLTIQGLQLTMGSDVRLRSSEADIQLAGRLQVDKVGDRYRYDGTLSAPRGTYRMPIANSEFNVTGGEVQYFGTPDLNAGVNINARTEVRTVRGDNVTVFANIGGTLYEPQLTLSSDIQPPIPQSEIISYLVFRAPSVEALAGTDGAGLVQLNAVVTAATGALFSQLERTLISDLGVPIDYLQIRQTSSLQLFRGTQIAVGFQVGEKTFVTWNPRLCGYDNIAKELFYPGLDYRFSTAWRLSFSIDPANSCGAFGRRAHDFRSQIGADLLWEKRY